MADEERTPIDDLVDLLVYAPLGLLYEYEEVLPQLIRRGKSQVQLAKVLGTMAVNQRGSVPANQIVEAVASMVLDRVTEIGATIGLTPPGAPGTTKPARAASQERGSTGAKAGKAAESSTGDQRQGRQPRKDGGDGDDAPLPIASYDKLTAREIIGLLDELDAGQLARIRAHEEATRARKTVLGKLDRLEA